MANGLALKLGQLFTLQVTCTMAAIQMSLVCEEQHSLCCNPSLEENLLGCKSQGTNVLTGECGDLSACQGDVGPGSLEVGGPSPSSSWLICLEYGGCY